MDNGQQPGTDLAALKIRRAIVRWEFGKSLVPILYIGSLAIPIWAATPIAEALAGKSTNVTVTVSVTIALTLAISAGAIALWRKVKAQANELRRLRRRNTELEIEVARLKGLNP